eukprot:Em0006g497a
MVSLYVSVGLLVQLTLLTDRLRANPTGAPLAACSTLVPAHQAVSPTPCGDKCPYKMSVISGNLPRPFMYRCGDEYTLRLQTSGPPFKGLVVQSRRSTAVFDGSSSFVGSFASGGADWKQWNCESVPVLTGKLPHSMDIASLSNGKHSMRILLNDQSAETMSFTLNDAIANTLVCQSDVRNNVLNVSCAYSRPLLNTLCSIDLQPFYQCKLPFTRSLKGLPSGTHKLTVLATDTGGANISATTKFNTTGPRFSCIALTMSTLLNVNCVSDTPFITAKCSLNQDTPKPCTIPYTRDISVLSVGSHQVTVSVNTTTGTMLTTTESFVAKGTLPYTRSVSALSTGIHTISISASGANGVNGSFAANFSVQGTIPYARDITDLAIGAHTIAVTATGVNGATAAVTEYFTRPEFLRCTGILNSSVLAIQCNSSKALKDVWCTLDNKETHACVLPYVRSVSSLSTGLHTMNISATAVTGVVVSDTVPFNLQARLTLNCSRTFQNSMLVVRCSPSSPLDDVSCSFDTGVQRTCHLPLAFNASSLTPGEHTVHITAKGSNGATATSSLTFQIDGMLPYVRRVTSLSLGRHALSLYFIGENGRNTTVEMDFFIQARLNLQCSYIIAEGAKLMVSCTPSDLLARATCAVNNETLQSCNLPYTRDVSVLPRGVHTVTVSATGTNGVSSISVLSFDNTATISLNCIAAGSAPIDRVLVVNCTSSAPLSYATCAVDGEIPLPCGLSSSGVFPHVKNVLSLPSGVHVVAVSAIGTNRASSVAMVKFNVADLVANCSGAVHGRNLYITCDANYPIQFTTCSVGQRQPQQCDMPITLPVDNFSEGIHSLDITVNATNKAATVSVRFMVNTDGSAVLLKP